MKQVLPDLVMTLGAVGLMVLAVVIPMNTAPPAGKVFSTTPKPSGEPIPFGEETLTTALNKWKEATGITIPRPKLIVGDCGASEDPDNTLACADLIDNRIIFTRLWFESEHAANFLGVMLHEVGHLYLVKHIPGDELMSAAIPGPVSKITPAAIEMALQIHGKEPPPKPKPVPPERRMPTEGLACELGDAFVGDYSLHDKAGFVWDQPKEGRWDCTDGKWRRDYVTEQKIKELEDVAAALPKRKLTSSELRQVKVAADPYWRGSFSQSPWSRMFAGGVVFSGSSSDYDRARCNASATETADLTAQLSFWNPPETELPIKLMVEYVKGIQCDSGSKRAYDILNDRIIEWLEKQQ